MSTKKFSFQLETFKGRVQVSMADVIRETALGVFGLIVDNSPVLSGRFAANWQLAIKKPPSKVRRWKGSPADAKRFAKESVNMEKLNKVTEDTTVFIVNLLPYANRLEHGWSKQAPEGMVRKAIAEFPHIVERHAKKAHSRHNQDLSR